MSYQKRRIRPRGSATLQESGHLCSNCSGQLLDGYLLAGACWLFDHLLAGVSGFLALAAARTLADPTNPGQLKQGDLFCNSLLPNLQLYSGMYGMSGMRYKCMRYEYKVFRYVCI